MKFRFTKKKKYREHAAYRAKQLYVDDATTQCGSQVPLVSQDKYSDAPSVCATASMSPSGTNSTASPGTPDSKDDAGRKNSFLCLVNKGKSRSSPRKKLIFDEEESWPQPWQDGASPPDIDGQLQVNITQSTRSESPVSMNSRDEHLDYPIRPIPVARSFPFDEEGGEDLVSSWINDADSVTDGDTASTGPTEYHNSTNSDEDTDAATGPNSVIPTDDDLSTSRGTGSIYTYGTGFSRFSSDTGLDSYATSTAFNGLQLVEQNSITSNSQTAQSSAASTSNSLAYSHSSMSAGNTTFEGNHSLLDEVQGLAITGESSVLNEAPSFGTFDDPISLQQGFKTDVPLQKEVIEETASKTFAVEEERRRKRPSTRDIFTDIGILAGEIFVDVRDSVSCAVDTTRDTVKEFNGSPCFSGERKRL